MVVEKWLTNEEYEAAVLAKILAWQDEDEGKIDESMTPTEMEVELEQEPIVVEVRRSLLQSSYADSLQMMREHGVFHQGPAESPLSNTNSPFPKLRTLSSTNFPRSPSLSRSTSSRLRSTASPMRNSSSPSGIAGWTKGSPRMGEDQMRKERLRKRKEGIREVGGEDEPSPKKVKEVTESKGKEKEVEEPNQPKLKLGDFGVGVPAAATVEVSRLFLMLCKADETGSPSYQLLRLRRQ